MLMSLSLNHHLSLKILSHDFRKLCSIQCKCNDYITITFTSCQLSDFTGKYIEVNREAALQFLMLIGFCSY